MRFSFSAHDDDVRFILGVSATYVTGAAGNDIVTFVAPKGCTDTGSRLTAPGVASVTYAGFETKSIVTV